MRICVFGAGAIGGNFAARLAAAGNDVSVIVRGAHLDAIRQRGLTLLTGERKIVAFSVFGSSFQMWPASIGCFFSRLTCVNVMSLK